MYIDNRSLMKHFHPHPPSLVTCWKGVELTSPSGAAGFDRRAFGKFEVMRFNHALWPACAWRGMMSVLKMWSRAAASTHWHCACGTQSRCIMKVHYRSPLPGRSAHRSRWTTVPISFKNYEWDLKCSASHFRHTGHWLLRSNHSAYVLKDVAA